MRLWTLLLVAIALSGCNLGTRSGEHVGGLTAQQRAEVEDGARRFMARVAEDVTREGPAAWREEFADQPEFFMASNGQLAFASGRRRCRGSMA